MYYFEPKEQIFYIEGMNEDIPDNCVKVTEEEFQALLAAKGKGKNLVVKNGKVVAEDVPAPDIDPWDKVRTRRNKLLKESDWIVSVPDYPLTEEKKQEWLNYRKDLRDITNRFDTPEDVVWPKKPD